jgi:retron-type reverse transcriptase
LHQAWRQSRDATGKPGRPGIDEVSAKQFASNLDANLALIAGRLKDGTFGFSKLRPVFVPKPNSEKDRMICVPTVQDRLVQRAMAEYLSAKKLFPIYNDSSFGFVKGRGVREAIEAVVRYREEYSWCLKTDIEAFFDRIPREYLKQIVSECLGRHSMVPLLNSVIGCEVKVKEHYRRRWEKQGIKYGRGIRQGMPLSSLLANLVLSDFDQRVNAPVFQ